MSHIPVLWIGEGRSALSKHVESLVITVTEVQSDLGQPCLLQRCFKETSRRHIVAINNIRAL